MANLEKKIIKLKPNPELSLEKIPEEIIKQHWDRIPKKVRGVISAFNWESKVEEIGKKHKLHIDQMGELRNETLFMLVGLTHPGDFYTKIQEVLELPEEKTTAVVNDINEQIFSKIRQALVKAVGEEEEEEAWTPPSPEKIPQGGERVMLQQYDNLPDDVKEVIIDLDLPKTIAEIGRRNDIKEVGDLEDVISLVLLGFTHPDELSKEIREKFNIRESKADAIAEDIEILIFRPIRPSLVKAYADKMKEFGIPLKAEDIEVLEKTGITLEETAPKSLQAVTAEKITEIGGKEEEILKTAGVEVETPIQLTPDEKLVPADEITLERDDLLRKIEKPPPTKAPSIAGEKLKGTFTLPKEEKDYSLKKPSATTTPTPKKEVDPYREKVD